ncbi:MAG: hypothetical protein ACRBI6_04505 [Acidimicrobiales bacterium]
MTVVTNVLSNGNAVDAAQLNTNFNDLIALATSIPAGNLQGGINASQLADGNGLVHVAKTIAGFAPNGDLTSPSGLTIDATPRIAEVIQPTVRDNWEAYLCSFRLNVIEADLGAGVDDWNFELRKNSGAVVGGTTVVVDGALNDRQYLVGNADPIANPLTSFADGERFLAYIWDASGTAQPRGVTLDVVFKYALVP